MSTKIISKCESDSVFFQKRMNQILCIENDNQLSAKSVQNRCIKSFGKSIQLHALIFFLDCILWCIPIQKCRHVIINKNLFVLYFCASHIPCNDRKFKLKIRWIAELWGMWFYVFQFFILHLYFFFWDYRGLPDDACNNFPKNTNGSVPSDVKNQEPLGNV